MSSDILSKIIEAKKVQVKTAQDSMPLSKVKKIAENRIVESRFLENFSKEYNAINIIAEIKRASPSKGDICIDLDPAKMAESYEKGGAAAISVLTEPDFFKGSIDDLKAVKAAVEIPVLRKDFIISEYQIYESAAIGADAILLIVRCLELNQLRDFMRLADSLSLDCLVEVYSEDDVKKAIDAEATFIGINNRNLKNFDTSIKHAISISSLLKGFQTPVAASGIESPVDIELNKAYGISNFLVGESIVRSGNPEQFIKQLRGTAK
ncbi:MAG: indole-3-glycerol phosphate synthase TrpC [Sedimentisphaeraceae bacterium JB056]